MAGGIKFNDKITDKPSALRKRRQRNRIAGAQSRHAPANFHFDFLIYPQIKFQTSRLGYDLGLRTPDLGLYFTNINCRTCRTAPACIT